MPRDGKLGIPGLFPGQVVSVRHKGAYASGRFDAAVIRQMFETAMPALGGGGDWRDAWKLLFAPGDVVAIKVSPVAQPYVISSAPVLQEIVRGLEAAGVKRGDIVVYDRYRADLFGAGIAAWAPEGVRIAWASETWDEVQQSLDGYDRDIRFDFGVGLPGQDATRFEVRHSFGAAILRSVNKIVNLSTLKDHQAAGVTLSLKNLSHGFFNNVNRTHPEPALNYTRQFIPLAVSQAAIRERAVLQIIDGIRGQYHGGPQPEPEFVWQHNTLYFGTDPVALDRVGWDVLDRERVARGMAPLQQSLPDSYSVFLERQSDHILQAGAMGLGQADLSQIRQTRIALDGSQAARPGLDRRPTLERRTR